jgi:ParB/RepB/Spo0J family partition protein
MAESETRPVRFVRTNAMQERRVGAHGADDLVASISSIGLLHPIVVDMELNLLAGARRLAAVKQLGWKEVPVTVVDPGDREAFRLTVARDENVCRKAFTISELAALDDLLRPMLEGEAAEAKRIGAARSRAKRAGTSDVAQRARSEPTRTKEAIAAAAGVSHDTVGRLKRVRDVAARVAATPDAYEPEVRATVARVHEDVLAGRMSVTAGVAAINNVVPPRVRRDAGVPKATTLTGTPDTGRRRTRPAGHVEKMRNLIGTLTGFVSSPIDASAASKAARPGEVDQWHAALIHALPRMRQLAKTLKEGTS